MLFAKADKILIKNLVNLKGYNAKHLVREFPSKRWNVFSTIAGPDHVQLSSVDVVLM